MSASYIQPLPAMREYSQEDKLELYKWQTNQKAIYKKHGIINVENGENENEDLQVAPIQRGKLRLKETEEQ